MKKITFKNKLFNLITAGFFLVAAIMALIGLIWVDEINFLGGKSLYYLMGMAAIVFAGINMFASFKKNNQSAGNIVVLIINAIIIIFGIGQFIVGIGIARGRYDVNDIFFLFEPNIVFGLALYLEGVQLVLISKFNSDTTIKRTLCGVGLISLGVVSFIFIKSEYISYFLDGILFLIGIFYLIVGLKPIIESKRVMGATRADQVAVVEPEQKKDEEKPQIEEDTTIIKRLFKKDKKTQELDNDVEILQIETDDK